jgi:hypothetical protein
MVEHEKQSLTEIKKDLSEIKIELGKWKIKEITRVLSTHNCQVIVVKDCAKLITHLSKPNFLFY